VFVVSLSKIVALVYFTPIAVVVVLCIIVLHLLVPPSVHFVVFVHVVSIVSVMRLCYLLTFQ
jgi:hypothetical protein